MLTKEQNELLTRTGPDSAGGALLRCYWQPVALCEELPPGGSPIPVRVLSENLALFRDEQGRPGLLGLHCAHRGADLSYGRLEDGGLRCLYHGWLYDVTGRCLEQPGEPAGSTFKDRVRQTAYPCQEAGGLILAYLGPGEPPVLPAYEFLQVPDEQRWLRKIFHACNYLQGNEGGIDPVHTSYLHRQVNPAATRGAQRARDVQGTDISSSRLYNVDTAPPIYLETTDFGMRLYAIRKAGPDKVYRRITNFLMPNLTAFPGQTGGEGYSVNWHVPIDDTHHWRYTLTFSREQAVDKEGFDREIADEVTADYRPLRNAGNRYLQDRDEMKARTFTGMGTSFPVHDLFASESQGPIHNRTAERLGATDKAVTTARRIMLQAIQDVQEGRDPPHVVRDARSNDFRHLVVVSDMLPASADWHISRPSDLAPQEDPLSSAPLSARG
jgi:phthalate 4,5-dioxygenase